MTTAVPLVQAGPLRALGISSANRSPVMPDVPAVAEFVPDFDVVAWNAHLRARRHAAADHRQAQQAIAAIVRSPAISQRLREQGTTGAGSTPAELAAIASRDTKKFDAALAAAGIERQ